MISNQELHDIFTGQKEVIDGHGALYIDGLGRLAYFYKEDNPKRFTNFNLVTNVTKHLFAYREDTRFEESADELFLSGSLMRINQLFYSCNNVTYIKLLGSYRVASIGVPAKLLEIYAPNCTFEDISVAQGSLLDTIEVGSVTNLNFLANSRYSPISKLVSHGKVLVYGANSFNYWRNGFTIWLLSESQDELLMPGSGQTACYTKPTATIKCKTQALCDYCASLWAELNPNFTFEVLTEEELHDYLG